LALLGPRNLDHRAYVSAAKFIRGFIDEECNLV
jgi:hypothetical protein